MAEECLAIFNEAALGDEMIRRRPRFSGVIGKRKEAKQTETREIPGRRGQKTQTAQLPAAWGSQLPAVKE